MLTLGTHEKTATSKKEGMLSMRPWRHHSQLSPGETKKGPVQFPRVQMQTLSPSAC